MSKVLVVFGSRHGATEGIARRIGDVLRSQGLAAPVVSADVVSDEDVRESVGSVVGSAVYMGHWLKEPTEFLEHYPTSLRARAVWLFSSGPLPGSTRSKDPSDPLTQRSVRQPGRAAVAARGSRSSPHPSPHAIIESSWAGMTRTTLRGRSPNVSSACCRWRKASSRTAISGTGQTSMPGRPRDRGAMVSPAVPV